MKALWGLVIFMLSASSARAEQLALVFDPLSNVRKTPNGALSCSVTQKGREIRIFEESTTLRGWFATDVCGSRGWISNSQFKVFTRARVRGNNADVRTSAASSATVQCRAKGGVRVFATRNGWAETDYCGSAGWIASSQIESVTSLPTVALTASLAAVAKFAPTCNNDSECQNAGTVPECADALTGACVSGRCYYAAKPLSTCPCWDGQVRTCPSSTAQFNFCNRVSTDIAKWDDACGPSQENCNPQRPACTTGTRTSSYDGAMWNFGACAAASSCPQEGQIQECATNMSACPKGVQTYTVANGWGACAPQNNCTAESAGWKVLVRGGDVVKKMTAACGSVTTGGPRDYTPAKLVEIGTGKTKYLDGAGDLGYSINDNLFRDAVIKPVFDGNRLAGITVVSLVDRRLVAWDGVAGVKTTLTERAEGVTFDRFDGTRVILEFPTQRLRDRALRAASAPCSSYILFRGRYTSGVTNLKVDSVDAFPSITVLGD